MYFLCSCVVVPLHSAVHGSTVLCRDRILSHISSVFRWRRRVLVPIPGVTNLSPHPSLRVDAFMDRWLLVTQSHEFTSTKIQDTQVDLGSLKDCATELKVMCNPSDKDERVTDEDKCTDTDMQFDGGRVEDVAHVTTKRLEQQSILSTDEMEECILTLRDVYVAVDFDAALWDSLFASSTCSTRSIGSNAENTAPVHSTSTKAPVMPCGRMSKRGTHVPFASISTLASVLAFLQIDDSSIPPEYLAMEPASAGLELYMLHHPHLHDHLLHAITKMLLRITTELHSHHVSQRARSVQEHADMLNRAIQQLTEINRNQLPEQSHHHQHHQQQQRLQLHRAVSATATCTATRRMPGSSNPHPRTVSTPTSSSSSSKTRRRQVTASHHYY